MRHSIPSTSRAPRFWAGLSRALLGFFLLWAGVFLPVAHAQQADFLPPDEAFQFTAKVQDAKTVLLSSRRTTGITCTRSGFILSHRRRAWNSASQNFLRHTKFSIKTSATRCFTTAD